MRVARPHLHDAVVSWSEGRDEEWNITRMDEASHARVRDAAS